MDSNPEIPWVVIQPIFELRKRIVALVLYAVSIRLSATLFKVAAASAFNTAILSASLRKSAASLRP